MKLTWNFLQRRQTPVESCDMATQHYLLVSSPSIASMGFVMAMKLWHNANLQKFPFMQIFFACFPQPPRVVVYDNACKLHVDCLNREPGHFQKTLFLVDHFHWRGHTGCSSCYNLDLYGEPMLKTLNSQINEQTNADLQKIQGQLAYMTPANFQIHLALFISVKNCNIIHAMDLFRLCVSWYCIHSNCCIIILLLKHNQETREPDLAERFQSDLALKQRKQIWQKDIYQIWNHSERNQIWQIDIYQIWNH